MTTDNINPNTNPTGVPENAAGAPGVPTGTSDSTTGAPGVPTGTPDSTTGVPGASTGTPNSTTGAPGIPTGAPDSTTGASAADSAEAQKRSQELAQAYADDRERKRVREDELEAAKEYLTVLLQEAEGKSEELQVQKAENAKLQSQLETANERITQLEAEDHDHRVTKSASSFWMCFALVEIVLVAGLAIALMFSMRSNRIGNEGGTGSGSHQPAVTTITEPTPAPELTAVYTEGLEAKAKALSAESTAPFECSAQTVDGLEYLSFSYGDVSVLYKNEYLLSEMTFRKAVIIENAGERIVFSDSYDLGGDLSALCPTITTIGGEEFLCFAAGSPVPSLMRLVSCKSLAVYSCDSIAELVRASLKTELVPAGRTNFAAKNIDEVVLAETEQDAQATAAAGLEGYILAMDSGSAMYYYSVSESDYNNVVYYENDPADVESRFNYTANADGIKWSTYVLLDDNYYLGELSGYLIPSDGTLKLSGVRYGAFVPFDQENPERQRIIIPAEAVPDRYLTVSGDNGERFLVAFNENVKACSYNMDNLITDDPNNWVYVDDGGNIVSHRGIDVSKYQADIDWNKVAEAGVEFAIIRMGFRGMNEGTLETDPYFTKNMKGATQAGLKVGVYFFSQAVNEDEAIAEADFVAKAIKDYEITYPVVFDTERVSTYAARANGLSVQTRTAVCRSFCDRIKEHGYRPMIYANTKYMLMGLDLEQLNDYDKWFACYNPTITYPYDFTILQYTDGGVIPGVGGNVDINICFEE